MTKNHKYEQIKVSDLKGYEKNARVHSAEQVQQVVNSIKEFGFTNPVLIDEENVLIAGHGRTEAAKILGLEKVPAIRLNGLTDAQKKALRIADNQLALNATWDEDLLAAELEEIHLENFDLDLLGFDDDFLNGLLDFDGDEKEVIQDKEPDKEAEREKRVNVGDIWQLGRHRLFCGDSTKKENIEKLMNGARADITFSSPPYNMAGGFNFSGMKRGENSSYRGENGAYKDFKDDLNNEDYKALLVNALKVGLAFSDDVLFNIGIVQGSKFGIIGMLNEFKENFIDVIAWEKSNFMPLALPPQKNVLSHKLEFIYCFNAKGGRAFSHIEKIPLEKKVNVIKTANAAGNEYAKEHGATFPVEFAAEVCGIFSRDSVLELFGGTGTTLIACEQINRTCFISELSPDYCDIILERFENLTGKKAVKLKELDK